MRYVIIIVDIRNWFSLVVLVAGVPTQANDLASIGKALFFDPNLSLNRTQACASCHNPAVGFTDSRENHIDSAVSLGDDGRSLGDRNTPTIAYASLITEFGKDETGVFAGGLFLDGRARNLAEQAAEPFTNPIEMNLPNIAAVVERVRQNPNYVDLFEAYFGADIFVNDEKAFKAIRTSIVAYEHTREFASFDSKYDRYLRGEYKFTDEEELGRKLFYSQLFNCHECHLKDQRAFHENEPFSTYRYFNIGLPVNSKVRAKNGLGMSHVDRGLYENPRIDDLAQAGKFRVPTLRNVAVTAPYMHNGIFAELETAVLFYNRFILTSEESQINPETGKHWREPEVPDTVDLALLQQGQPISSLQLPALIAFLETLTDKRYESLLTK